MNYEELCAAAAAFSLSAFFFASTSLRYFAMSSSTSDAGRTLITVWAESPSPSLVKVASSTG